MAKLTETGSLIDFKRIEWIFSSVFGVECLLFNIYSEARSEQQNVLQSNQTIPIEQRLASEDIKYSGELSDEYLSGYYLSGEQTDLAAALREAQGEKRLTEATTVKGQQLTHISSGGFYISDDTQAEKTVNEYLQRKDQVLYGDEYHYRKTCRCWIKNIQPLLLANPMKLFPSMIAQVGSI